MSRLFLHPRVDYIVCNTSATEEVFHKQLFFDKSKTVVIEKGHDPAWYNQKPPYNMRQELGLSEDAFLLINAANNRDMKGIPDLLEAMAQLPLEADIHLLLVGRDMETAENRKIVEGTAAEQKVHFLGFREDVVQIVGGCNVFTLSSKYGEALTKAVIEAMAQKVTPVITDIPGNKELVVDGESGLVVPAQNPKAMVEAILKLYNDADLCNKLADQAYLRIQTRLSASETVNNYDKFFRSIV
jgi:glycosyltransferase involved in cell wall biosynthesis